MTIPHNIIYLEAYVESTGSLPPELQRMLTLIKSLDERCDDLLDSLQQNTALCVQRTPIGGRKNAAEAPPDMQKLMKRIEEDQAMLKQLADEKVQVANQAYDLLEMHSTELDNMLENFEAEFAAANPLPNPQDASELFGVVDQMTSKRPKLEPWESFNTSLDLGSLSVPVPKSRGGHKGRREDTLKRKGTSNASQYASQLQADDYTYIEQPTPAGTFMSPIPPGMQAAAPRPQRPGQLLQYNDISPTLRGRIAEVFWPKDNLWYLIEIQNINMQGMVAEILYVTGETEDLSLDEIVKEGHMSLIN